MSSTESPRLDQGLSAAQVRQRICIVAFCLSAVVASYFYAPVKDTGPVICPMRLFSGLPCPGCGLTRSFCSLSHGKFLAALKYNAVGPVVFVGFIGAVVLLPVEAARRRRLAWLHRLVFSRRAGRLALAIVFGYHLARLLYMAGSGALVAGMKHSMLGTAVIRVCGWS